MQPEIISSPIRILLVEDDVESQKAVSRLLSRRGFVVAVAGSVAEAKKLTEVEDHFNLVISDMGLPDGTGLQFMEWLRKKTPGLPVIALTAYGLGENKSDAAGFSAHLSKPLDIETLRQAILRYAAPTQH